MIKENGMKVGIGIKPGTNVELLLPYCSLLDQLLVMTVEPGFGGVFRILSSKTVFTVRKNRFIRSRR